VSRGRDRQGKPGDRQLGRRHRGQGWGTGRPTSWIGHQGGSWCDDVLTREGDIQGDGGGDDRLGEGDNERRAATPEVTLKREHPGPGDAPSPGWVDLPTRAWVDPFSPDRGRSHDL